MHNKRSNKYGDIKNEDRHNRKKKHENFDFYKDKSNCNENLWRVDKPIHNNKELDNDKKVNKTVTLP